MRWKDELMFAYCPVTTKRSVLSAKGGKLGALCSAQEVLRNSCASPTYSRTLSRAGDDYCLSELSEVERFVRDHGHLPDIPSEKQVRTEGQNLAKMNALLLLKLEELYLHVIKLDKEIQQLKATNP